MSLPQCSNIPENRIKGYFNPQRRNKFPRYSEDPFTKLPLRYFPGSIALVIGNDARAG